MVAVAGVVALACAAGCAGAVASGGTAATGHARRASRTTTATRHARRTSRTTTPTRHARRSPAATGSTYDRLVQYPGAGFRGLYGQIAGARRTIDMEMYELADTTAEHDLAAAAARGVKVRVLLDKDFSGGEVNASAYAYLHAHRVDVEWAPAGYIFHIKATTFDGTTSDISSANLTSKYYATTRDAEIVDTDPAQVGAIEGTFQRDWSAAPAGHPQGQTVQGPGLVWSPDTGSGTAETALAGEIKAARTSIDFESEELSDPAVVAALAADARRGVDCRIVMTSSSEWDDAFSTVSHAGCHVHVFPDSDNALYIHEKLILDDASTARASMFLGSQNASVTSLTRNRELGIILHRAHGGGAAMASAARTFDTDFTHASAWSPPSTAPKPKPKPTPTPKPKPTPTPTPAGCHPHTSTGHCYEPGEYCSDADHGMSGVAGDGEPIVCKDDDGWRWEAK